VLDVKRYCVGRERFVSEVAFVFKNDIGSDILEPEIFAIAISFETAECCGIGFAGSALALSEILRCHMPHISK
jgi:hypothetical protein